MSDGVKSKSLEEFLAEENSALKRAGSKLAEAALHLARDYDGVHRLMLAVSEWAAAVANEGGRGAGKDAGEVLIEGLRRLASDNATRADERAFARTIVCEYDRLTGKETR